MKHWFGTDGIRGVAGEKLTARLALALGEALGAWAVANDLPLHLVVGGDSRVSSPMLMQALGAGASAMGLRVTELGLCPTPAVALLTKELGAGLGVMVSASHNPVNDNGLKVFGGDGFKLTDEQEVAIEALLNQALEGTLPGAAIGTAVGEIHEEPETLRPYLDRLRGLLPGGLPPLRLGIDCAHGAACEAAHALFDHTQHAVHWLADVADGHRINVNCGSTDLSRLQDAMVSEHLDIGFAFDGDADRLLVVDAGGHVVDGDLIMFVLTLWLKQQGKLTGNRLVSTQMSNIGLDEALKKEGVAVTRTQVGDRYVLEEMRKSGAVLGGEQSGHLIYLGAGTTGDGLLSAVLLLAARADGLSFQEAAARMTLKKQRLTNRQLSRTIRLADYPDLTAFQDEENARLNGKARYYLRPSGTEPLMRLLVEADTGEELDAMTQAGWARIGEALGDALAPG